MSNLFKTLVVFGVVYFTLHILGGYFYCQKSFCPGENQSDWVYEYTDDDGKKFVVVDGKEVPSEQYKELK